MVSAVRQLVRQPARFRRCSWVYADLRETLGPAVRAAGFDPGGQVPVRLRALDAAAALISTSGLAAATLEAIAARAECSVHSLYAVFGGRDELLRAVFERHSPLLYIEDFLATPPSDLPTAVRRLYGLIADALTREPRVGPALLAEVMARPDGSTFQNLLQHNAPRLLASLGAWLTGHVQAGHIRDLPLPLLIQQLVAPVAIHMLVRPVIPAVPGFEQPDTDAACDLFAEAFLRAVGTGPRAEITKKTRRSR